jgi:hypothetical protein
MTIPSFRTAEPLYIVIVRNNPQAETNFKSWIKENRIDYASVSGNRMMLHHQQAFDSFLVSWKHNWDLVTIWDTWRRQHIYVN